MNRHVMNCYDQKAATMLLSAIVRGFRLRASGHQRRVKGLKLRLQKQEWQVYVFS